jgi:two-component system chemotaxis response regulator CheB
LIEQADEGQLRRVEDALEGNLDTRQGELAPYTCPECNGNLWEVNDGGLIRLRCRVGHSYTEEAMLAAQGTAVEAALWGGYRALEERIALKRRLAKRLEQRGATSSARRLEEEAMQAEEHAAVMRQVLEQATEPQAGEAPATAGSA